MSAPDWNGQNKPVIYKEGGSFFSILPVLEFLLDYDEDTITDLLDSAESYGWDDGLTNAFAWAGNAYRAADFIPDFSRHGCLPAWFPEKDREGHLLTGQGQADRFLYLLDKAYGGLPDDHRQARPHAIAQAIMDLKDDFGTYVDSEEQDQAEWELA